MYPRLGIKPDPLVCRSVFNPLSHTSQGWDTFSRMLYYIPLNFGICQRRHPTWSYKLHFTYVFLLKWIIVHKIKFVRNRLYYYVFLNRVQSTLPSHLGESLVPPLQSPGSFPLWSPGFFPRNRWTCLLCPTLCLTSSPSPHSQSHSLEGMARNLVMTSSLGLKPIRILAF